MFRLNEIGVTVALAATVATMAMPSLGGILASQRARNYASALNVALDKSRLEALARKGDVTLQPKPGGWSSGWQMLDPNNKVLDQYTVASGVTVVGPGSVTFRASGHLPADAVPPIFQITTTSGVMMSRECVSVDSSGQPSLRAAATC